MSNRSLTALAALLLWSSQAQAQAPATGPEPTNRPEAGNSAILDVAFRRADVDGDGRLSSEELRQFPALATRLDDLDADKDGFVSNAEFRAGVTVKKEP